jgi:hypothetical protein
MWLSPPIAIKRDLTKSEREQKKGAVSGPCNVKKPRDAA